MKTIENQAIPSNGFGVGGNNVSGLAVHRNGVTALQGIGPEWYIRRGEQYSVVAVYGNNSVFDAIQSELVDAHWMSRASMEHPSMDHKLRVLDSAHDYAMAGRGLLPIYA